MNRGRPSDLLVVDGEPVSVGEPLMTFDVCDTCSETAKPLSDVRFYQTVQ